MAALAISQQKYMQIPLPNKSVPYICKAVLKVFF